jgi:hypothetical protein
MESVKGVAGLRTDQLHTALDALRTLSDWQLEIGPPRQAAVRAPDDFPANRAKADGRAVR